jgi:hypothetical protein
MTDPSKNRLVRLKYYNDRFPGLDWIEFLKICDVNFYTNRNDALWYSIRGKGFIIWITSNYARHEDGEIVWYTDLEINKHAPSEGMQALQELVDGALAKFDKMKVEYIHE